MRFRKEQASSIGSRRTPTVSLQRMLLRFTSLRSTTMWSKWRHCIRSGNWGSIWRAYQFLQSTYDDQNFPKNFGVGHGWVEGGPLLPVKTEYYQSGLGLECLRALSNLAKLTGKQDVNLKLSQSFDQQLPILNKAFCLPKSPYLRSQLTTMVTVSTKRVFLQRSPCGSVSRTRTKRNP